MTRLRRLPDRTDALIETVGRFKQATTSQLRRLHYQGLTEGSQRSQAGLNLLRLYEAGKLRRVWGVYHHGVEYSVRQEAEYVYTLPNSTAKADDHRLDITELYVRLAVMHGPNIHYLSQPYLKVGHTSLEPDASLKITEDRTAFFEIDRSSEHGTAYKVQMRHYCNVFENYWREAKGTAKFPAVIWVVHTQKRLLEFEEAIKDQRVPGLFRVRLFDDVVTRLKPSRG